MGSQMMRISLYSLYYLLVEALLLFIAILLFYYLLSFQYIHRNFRYSKSAGTMGQDNQNIIKPHQPSHELQVVDERQGIFLNIRNNKLYIKNDVSIGSIGDIEYELDIYQFRRLNDNYVVSVDYSSTI
jgi:hypothetical protein